MIKTIKRRITVENFVTSDGKEFNCWDDANKHEYHLNQKEEIYYRWYHSSNGKEFFSKHNLDEENNWGAFTKDHTHTQNHHYGIIGEMIRNLVYNEYLDQRNWYRHESPKVEDIQILIVPDQTYED